MSGNDIEAQPFFSHVEPVLPVKDVLETVTYWTEVLGFTNKWTWGDPPDHGGVTRQGVFVQFTLSPELAEKSKGNSIWIRVKHIEELYAYHREKNAEIVSPLENKPWGFAQYVVKEINGYYLVFAMPASTKEKRSEALPQSIRIILRKPTVLEHRKLSKAVGWGENTEENAAAMLSQVVAAVVAEDGNGNEVVGCALLLGDNVSYYYVKDVMVHPDWQCKNIGTAMMKTLTDWIDKNGPENVFVVLITPETLEPFYRQVDFSPAFGMIRINN